MTEGFSLIVCLLCLTSVDLTWAQAPVQQVNTSQISRVQLDGKRPVRGKSVRAFSIMNGNLITVGKRPCYYQY
jgi:hypothetical protein